MDSSFTIGMTSGVFGNAADMRTEESHERDQGVNLGFDDLDVDMNKTSQNQTFGNRGVEVDEQEDDASSISTRPSDDDADVSSIGDVDSETGAISRLALVNNQRNMQPVLAKDIVDIIDALQDNPDQVDFISELHYALQRNPEDVVSTIALIRRTPLKVIKELVDWLGKGAGAFNFANFGKLFFTWLKSMHESKWISFRLNSEQLEDVTRGAKDFGVWTKYTVFTYLPGQIDRTLTSANEWRKHYIVDRNRMPCHIKAFTRDLLRNITELARASIYMGLLINSYSFGTEAVEKGLTLGGAISTRTIDGWDGGRGINKIFFIPKMLENKTSAQAIVVKTEDGGKRTIQLIPQPGDSQEIVVARNTLMNMLKPMFEREMSFSNREILEMGIVDLAKSILGLSVPVATGVSMIGAAIFGTGVTTAAAPVLLFISTLNWGLAVGGFVRNKLRYHEIKENGNKIFA